MEEKQKPLPFKPYDKIPHFSCSRLGVGDHFVDKNKEKCALSAVPDQQTLVIVQEKLDGSNVCAWRKSASEVIALTRSGYRCDESVQEQHQAFARHVDSRINYFLTMLDSGERVVGEWLLLAHGTKYHIYDEWDCFIPFDIFTADNQRLNYHDFLLKALPNGFSPPPLLHVGGSCSIDRARRLIDKRIASNAERNAPFHTEDGYEGFIYRIERPGKEPQLIKFVHHDKIDAKHLIDETGKRISEEHYHWNFDPESI